MAKNSIRVGGSIKRIEVNDKGDYIVIRSDIKFYKKLLGLEKTTRNFVAKGEEIIERLNSGVISESAYEDELFSLYKTLHDEIDNVFGKNTCLKVFGEGEEDVLPQLFDVADFLEQLEPYFADIVEECVNKGNRFVDMIEKEVADTDAKLGGGISESKGAEITNFPVKEVVSEEVETKDEEENKEKEQVVLSKDEYDRLLELLNKYEV